MTVTVAVALFFVAHPFAGWGMPASATGGDQVYDVQEGIVNYRVHIFTNSGTFTVISGGEVDALVVGGGGGGGSRHGGGGGAGGFVYTSAYAMAADVYTVTVGAGGAGNLNSGDAGAGSAGENSGLATLIAHGGGYGNGTQMGGNGGAGGGGGAASGITSAGGTASVGQGYAGGSAAAGGTGWSGGGGGGAGGAGGDCVDNTVAGAGGPGVSNNISGSWVCYAGGGGGGTYYAANTTGSGGSGIGGAGGKTTELSSGGDGAANTGAGGGGGGNGGNGGAGIVIIRYVLESGPYSVAPNSTLTNVITGSARFTNTNAVRIATFPKYAGYDQFQYTGESGSIDDLNSENWFSTNALPGYDATFTRPTSDTNVTLYLWFTNTTDTAKPLLRSASHIYYTEVAPVPVVRSTLARERLPGANAVITVEDLDIGSSLGVADSVTLPLYARKVVAVDDGVDSTPGEPYATLAADGVYPLQLWLQNEAGNANYSAVTCMVTVTESASATNIWTGAGLTNLWSDGVNWSAGLPAAGQNVAIRNGNGIRLAEATPELSSFDMTGGSLIFSGWMAPLRATNVTIRGGTVTCAGDFDDTDPSNRVWIVCENDFSLTQPGQIDVSGQGYKCLSGPGAGIATDFGTGGGHGGQGGAAYKRGGSTCGNLYHPELPGSGGGPNNTVANPGGSGGGVVRIQAGGHANLAGAIAANGATIYQGGGGAGGSIYITATQVAGTADGLLTVKGGDEGFIHLGGGGGGGRIAIDGGTIVHPFSVRFSGTPGISDKDTTDTGEVAASLIPLDPHQAWTPGWGTLYVEDESLLSQMPANNQYDRVVLHIGAVRSWTVEALSLTNNSLRLAPQGFQVNVVGDLMVGANAHLGVEGSIACGGNLVLTNGARLSVYSGPTNGNGSVYGALVDVANDIVIAENAWLQPNSSAIDGGSVRLRMRNLEIIGVAAGINAMGRGFAAGHGSGMGGGTYYYGGGGGYGGMGGSTWNGPAGGTYGNPYAPLAPGSGAGGSWDGAPLFAGSGYGGGLISIEARNNVSINGQLQAGGGLGWGYWLCGGGGAGGGIFISCDRFTGTETALLSVKGGDSPYGGGGGGGRIAVWHKRIPSYLQAKLLTGVTSSTIANTNAPVGYQGQIDIAMGTGGTNAAPGTVWFIVPPPTGTHLILR